METPAGKECRGSMPQLEPRISFLTLGVSDLQRARCFYRDTLGWPLATKSNDYVAFFQLNGFVLALFPRLSLGDDAGVPLAEGGYSRVTLAYNVRERDEVDALLGQLAALGVKIVKPAGDAIWGGRTGYFCDTEQNLWEVAWNPGGYLDAEGNFRF